MYERRSRLNYRQQAELIKFFVAGATSRAAGEMAVVNRNTATSYFMRLRRLIASHLPSYRLSGEIEADESYFGGVRKGKRGRRSAGKIAVLGLLKRNGRVYTAIIPEARTELRSAPQILRLYVKNRDKDFPGGHFEVIFRIHCYLPVWL